MMKVKTKNTFINVYNITNLYKTNFGHYDLFAVSDDSKVATPYVKNRDFINLGRIDNYKHYYWSID